MSKLPRSEKKLWVAPDWTLDLIFSKDLVQFLTTRARDTSGSEAGGRQAPRVVPMEGLKNDSL